MWGDLVAIISSSPYHCPGVRSHLGSSCDQSRAMASEAELSALAELEKRVSKLSAPAAHLTTDEMLEAFLLGDVISEKMRSRAYEFITEAPGQPILFQYMSDGWSGWTHSHEKLRIDGKLHKIQTRRRPEFCLERVLIRSALPDTGVFMIIGAARIMLDGKGHQNFFTALTEFCKHPRLLNHRGVLSELYSFDGLLHTSMMRLIHGRHHMMYSREYGPGELADDSESTLLYLLNWVEGFGCGAHAASKAIEWGLSSVCYPTAVDDWHIAFESVRNSSADLFALIPQFISRFTRFRDQGSEESSAVRDFWMVYKPTTFSGDLIDKFLPFFKGGFLWVEYEAQFVSEVYDILCKMVAACFRMSKFCSTRWGGIKRCARQYMVSEAVGMFQVCDMLKRRVGMGSGHINGYFDRLKTPLRTFISVASLSADPTEQFLTSMLEDDRLLRHLERLEADMQVNIQKVCDVPPHVYSLVASLAGDDDLCGERLQQMTVSCTLASRAFLDRAVIRPCHALPFSLALGDISANLHALSVGPPPSNLTSRKIKALLEMGYSHGELISGIQLWKDASFTAHCVEKGHKACAVMLEAASSGMGTPRMTSQGLLNAIRLQFKQGRPQQQLALLDKQMAFLESRNVNKIRPNNIPLQLVGSAPSNATLPVDDGTSAEHRRTPTEAAMSTWTSLTAVEQEECRKESIELMKQKGESLQQEKIALRELIDRLQLVVSHSPVAAELANHVSSVRWRAEELHAIWSAFVARRKVKLGNRSVGAICDVHSPRVPDQEFIDILLDFYEEMRDPEPQEPWWARELCQQRDMMHGFVFWQTDPVAEDVGFLWMYGKKSPCQAEFLQLRRIIFARDHDDVAKFFRHNTAWREHVFTWSPMKFMSEAMVPFDVDGEYVALQSSVFLKPHYIVSNSEPIPLEVILSQLGKERPLRERAPARPRRPDANVLDSLIADHPWLQDHFNNRRRAAPRRPGALHDGVVDDGMADVASFSDAESDGNAESDGDVEVAEPDVLAALNEARNQLDFATFWDEDASFHVQWLGGMWTYRNTGQAFDRIVVKGTRARVLEFCTIFKWPKFRSYSKQKYLGESNVRMLAFGFCRKSRFFYRIWADAGFDPEFSFVEGSYTAYLEDPDYLDWALELELTSACFGAVVRDRGVMPDR